MTVRVLVYFTKGLGDVVLAEANQVAATCAVVEAADRYAVLEVGDPLLLLGAQLSTRSSSSYAADQRRNSRSL